MKPGEHEIERIELPEYTDEVWHVYVLEPETGRRVRLSRAWSL